MVRAPSVLPSRAVRIWLLVVAGLILATVLVGGATRLTESGLSITEWRPVTGVLPPFSQSGWEAEFERYKTIPQYRARPGGMSLGEFQSIYLWEWAHRLLGRVIGAAFLLPFLFFLWRGWIGPGLRARLWSIFGLGALQGAVGWWMVASGLVERVSVSQYRLAFHLTLACVIYALVVWTIAGLRGTPERRGAARLSRGAFALMLLVLAQIYVGALVAGLDAGLVYNTWPTIDGGLVPSAKALFALSPAWRNLFENELTVQFLHRSVAYALWIAALIHAVRAIRSAPRSPAAGSALVLALAVTAQAGLGIATLLQQVLLPMALAHQAMAMVVLTIAVVHAARLWPAREEALGAMPSERTLGGQIGSTAQVP